MSSARILERLRQALAPDYVVELELASGGMGSVFLGHEVALDRPVAIKLLRPELATTEAAERFLREARFLANLHHPNVVQVYRVGEADGLFFYVMEYISGETLEARLRRGRLPSGTALKLGRDLLDGLEAAHRAGVVHRDVKPANLLLSGRRTLLADFGIALDIRGRAPSDGEVMGTPGYMSPEQRAGGTVGVSSDLYAAGAVIYEAFTGRSVTTASTIDWRGVPRSAVPLLQRALARTPEDRWPDAASFRRALWRTRARRFVRRTFYLIGAALALGVVGTLMVPRLRSRGRAPTGALRIGIERVAVDGDSAPPWLGDSITSLVALDLAGHPDFEVVTDPAGEESGPLLTISARITIEGDSARGRIMAASNDGSPRPLGEDLRVDRRAWATLADSIATRVLVAVWSSASPFASSLPVKALPRTTAGLAEFIVAERLVGQARWADAYVAYARAEAIDPTCWLCNWRITEVERWLGRPKDPERARRALAFADSFPPGYPSMIRGTNTPLPARLDSLAFATTVARDFFLPYHLLGDELFHRGALVGHTRREALEPLERASRLRPDYVPNWEHLSWVRTAEGDSAGAALALGEIRRRGVGDDPYARELRALLEAGFAWRFFDTTEAKRGSQLLLSSPGAIDYPALGAGPRFMGSFDAAEGAVGTGELFLALPRGDLVRSGGIAAMLGSVALGRSKDVTEFGHRLLARVADPELELFIVELDGVRALLDRAGPPPEPASRLLRRHLAAGAATDLARRRSAWVLRLLERHAGVVVEHGTTTSLAREPAPRPFATLLLADSLATAGEFARALALTAPATLDSVARDLDPFYRVVTRWLRAGWLEASGNLGAARRELRWHEHTDLDGFPFGRVQTAEVDWAFSTLARWRRARLLERLGESGIELCGAYRAVARHWRGGDAVYAARADSAAHRADLLECEPGR